MRFKSSRPDSHKRLNEALHDSVGGHTESVQRSRVPVTSLEANLAPVRSARRGLAEPSRYRVSRGRRQRILKFGLPRAKELDLAGGDDAADLEHDDQRLEDDLSSVVPFDGITRLLGPMSDSLNSVVECDPVDDRGIEQCFLALTDVETGDGRSDSAGRLRGIVGFRWRGVRDLE